MAPLERLRAKAHSGHNVAVIKEGMNLLGLAPGRIREPGSGLDGTDRQELVRILRAWGKLDRGSNTVQLHSEDLTRAEKAGTVVVTAGCKLLRVSTAPPTLT